MPSKPSLFTQQETAPDTSRNGVGRIAEPSWIRICPD